METGNEFATFFANQLSAPMSRDNVPQEGGAFLLIFRKTGPEIGCCWAHVVMAEDLGTHFLDQFRRQIYNASMAALRHFRLDNLKSGATHPSDTLLGCCHTIASARIAAHEVTVNMFDLRSGVRLELPILHRTW